jgi:hypothetical protein
VLVEGADACANPDAVLALTIGLGVDPPGTPGAQRVAPAGNLAEAAHHALASTRIREVLGTAFVERLARVG